jgi:zinc transport system substrate-binding protein
VDAEGRPVITSADMRLILILALVGGGATACSSRADPHPGTVSVVASFYPLAEAVRQVGDDLVSVTNLTAPGVEPHDLELTPDQVASIARADLVLYLGGGFQPAVEDAIGEAGGTVLDVLTGIDTAAPPSGSEVGLAVDPHVWLDPERYARIVDEVRAALAGIDPSHADAFAAGASRFEDRINALDEEFRTGLADCQRTTIVTNHAAFGYLAAAYGLTQVGISGLDPEADVDPRRIAELRDLVHTQGITTIFTEDLVSPKVAETLANEAGVQTAVLHTLEGLTDAEVAAGADYVSEMRENLATLREALACA